MEDHRRAGDLFRERDHLLAFEIEPPPGGFLLTTPGRIVLAVEPEIGPGWLEFESPDLCVQWTVRSNRQRTVITRGFTTGPASTDGYWIERGGVLRAHRFLFINTVHVDPLNGLEIAGDLVPRLKARFWPADILGQKWPSYPLHVAEQVPLSLTQGTGGTAVGFDADAILASGVSVAMWPPGYRRFSWFSATRILTAQIRRPAGPPVPFNDATVTASAGGPTPLAPDLSVSYRNPDVLLTANVLQTWSVR